MNWKTNPLFRRELLVGAATFAAGIGASQWWTGHNTIEVDHHGLNLKNVTTADEAIARLIAGNKCYIDEHFAIGDGRRTILRRQETIERQRPYAVILSCSDSRVGPEILFSAGIGDLFAVRVAGNIVDPRCYGVLGSLEYAVAELAVPLIVVLGHEGCGAVKAAIRVVQEKIELPGAIAMIAAAIQPTVETISSSSDALLQRAVVANVETSMNRLRWDDAVITPRLKSGDVKLLGAVYDLKTGVVRLLNEQDAGHAK
jgi:carbonic anhydrase